MLDFLNPEKTATNRRFKSDKEVLDAWASSFATEPVGLADLAALHQYDEAIAPAVEQTRAEQSLIPAGTDKPWYEDVGDTVGHLAGRAGLSLLKGATDIGAAGADLVMSPYDAVMTSLYPDYQYSLNQGAFPRYKEYQQTWEETTKPAEQAMGLTGNTAENIVGGVAEFIPSLLISGGVTKLPSAVRAGEGLLSKATSLGTLTDEAAMAAEKAISNKVLGKGANIAVKNTPDIVNTWLMMEGPKPAEERAPISEWAAMWLGGEAVAKGLPVVAKGVKAKLGKGATKATPAIEEAVMEPVLGKGATRETPEAVIEPNLNPFRPTGMQEKANLPSFQQTYFDLKTPETGRAINVNSSKSFTQLMEDLKPIVEEKITPPMESEKALVNYVYEGFNGQISKNEIRKLSYEELAGVADDIAYLRKTDIYGLAKKEASKMGYDLEQLYKIETDPAFVAERARMAEVAGLGDNAIPQYKIPLGKGATRVSPSEPKPIKVAQSGEMADAVMTAEPTLGKGATRSVALDATPDATMTMNLGKGANPVPVNQGLGKGAVREIPAKMEQLENGQKVRSAPVSMAEAGWTDDTLKEGLISEMAPGKRGAYDPVNLADVDKQAVAMISKNPQEAIRFVMEEKNPSALHTATGIRLVENLQNSGNYERAIDVAMTLAENLTKSGQAISAARITSALKPDGVLLFAQRQINKINSERVLPKITKEAKLTPEDAQNLKKLAEIMQDAEGDAKIEASQELQQALQALSSSGVLRKVDALQTIGQLLNPKTIIRNTIGNELFYRLERINKYLSTPIDWAKSQLTGADRTVTFAKAGQTGYWEGFFTGVKAGWKGVNPKGIQTQYDLGQGLAFNPNPTRAINAKSGAGKVAGTILDAGERTASFLERVLGATLKGFDYAAYNRAYNQTLGELATLRAINEGKAGNKKLIEQYIKEADDNLRDIADQYGKYVTFQDNNVISTGLSKVKRGLNLGQDWGLGSMVLKYPRTPGALIMRGMEYSPAGFIRSAFQLAKVKNWVSGESTEREAMLALSRAITGTAGLTGMGYFLADSGVLKGSASNDKDVRNLQQQVGQGAYTVNLSALDRLVQSSFNPGVARPAPGDTLINYDWMQPIATAISMGANIQKSIEQNVNPFENIPTLASNAITGMAGGIDTIAEQPVLQGLERVLSTYPNESMAGKISRVISESARDVPSSFTPTVFNQVRSLLDNQKRITYDPNTMTEGLNKAQAKIPGLADELPKAYDTLGNEAKTYQADNNNPFNVFLNPAFITKYKPSPTAQMVIDIYNNTGETKQVPRTVNEYFNYTIEGKVKRIDLTPEEYSELQRLVGEETAKGFAKISPSAKDEDKIKQMVNVMNDAGDKGRKAILKARGIKG